MLFGAADEFALEEQNSRKRVFHLDIPKIAY
jgi:hypothetical protein